MPAELDDRAIARLDHLLDIYANHLPTEQFAEFTALRHTPNGICYSVVSDGTRDAIHVTLNLGEHSHRILTLDAADFGVTVVAGEAIYTE